MWIRLQLRMERSCSTQISWWPFEDSHICTQPRAEFTYRHQLVLCCFGKSRLHLHGGISMDYWLHQISKPLNATDHVAFQAVRQQYYSYIG
ncbi:Protein of unknown function [Pyronema omphalodes CBS 100304]|uniref:Uncharacterized protein n=1 Tax=Pyronema omphalodes (strain CBS 100304) TaxID=1076935 RepID=U4KXQ8_PYROM|nr:Protein of unknown function [Pyronema omphalodes CBS 100304]